MQHLAGVPTHCFPYVVAGLTVSQVGACCVCSSYILLRLNFIRHSVLLG